MERVRSTTLLRPFFLLFFLFHATIVIEGGGIGARSERFPQRTLCQPDSLEKTKDLNSGLCVWIPLGSTTQQYKILYGWVREPAVSVCSLIPY